MKLGEMSLVCNIPEVYCFSKMLVNKQLGPYYSLIQIYFLEWLHYTYLITVSYWKGESIYNNSKIKIYRDVQELY